MIEERLKELGIILPEAPSPMGSYVPAQWSGDLLYISGQGPMKDGKPTCTGRLGETLTLAQGNAAAREAALNLLAILKKELGSLDRVEQIVKLLGFVACDKDFTDQIGVVNGCSDVLVEVFGEKGRHARSAVGISSLPFGIPVEIEMIVRVKQ